MPSRSAAASVSGSGNRPPPQRSTTRPSNVARRGEGHLLTHDGAHGDLEPAPRARDSDARVRGDERREVSVGPEACADRDRIGIEVEQAAHPRCRVATVDPGAHREVDADVVEGDGDAVALVHSAGDRLDARHGAKGEEPEQTLSVERRPRAEAHRCAHTALNVSGSGSVRARASRVW